MSHGTFRPILIVGGLAAVLGAGGCSMGRYQTVVRPTPRLAALDRELAGMTDAKIEYYLKNNVPPVFPTVLAVARVTPQDRPVGRDADGTTVEVVQGDEAEGWRRIAAPTRLGLTLISQVQIVSPMLVGSPATLKHLRDAAALLHAPLLLVYMQSDTADQGYNSAAMAYWTIIGLFVVPGNTVGHYSACQGVLVDTRTGVILATVDGESKREEDVLPGAVDIAARRTQKQTHAEAVARLQEHFQGTLAQLSAMNAVPGTPEP
jgi:hypothetical protein